VDLGGETQWPLKTNSGPRISRSQACRRNKRVPTLINSFLCEPAPTDPRTGTGPRTGGWGPLLWKSLSRLFGHSPMPLEYFSFSLAFSHSPEPGCCPIVPFTSLVGLVSIFVFLASTAAAATPRYLTSKYAIALDWPLFSLFLRFLFVLYFQIHTDVQIL